MEKFISTSKRILTYIFGMYVLAVGVAFTILSDLGVSPVSAFPYFSSEWLNVDIAITTTAYCVGLVIIEIILLKNKFRPIDLLQCVSGLLFGVLLSLATHTIGIFLTYSESYIISMIYCLVGVVLVAFGIAIYVSSHLVPLAAEGMFAAMSVRFNIPMHTAKTIFDCLNVVLTVVVSYLALGEIMGIREGSIICALLVGIIIKFANTLFAKLNIFKPYTK